jgi:iron complex transport system substrate-binding protein
MSAARTNPALLARRSGRSGEMRKWGNGAEGHFLISSFPRFLANAVLAILLLLAAGCGRGTVPVASSAGSGPPAAGFPVAVTDDMGRRVTVPAPPRRIVSLAPAHTETLYALGLGDHLVAADTYSDTPPAAKAKAVLNCWPQPPVERIVALRPDLVLVLTEGPEFLRQMEAARIPALKLLPDRYENVPGVIELLGRVTGAEAAAQKLAESLAARSRALKERLKGVRRKRVLYELDASDPARPYVAGNGGFYGELLTVAGGENIFRDLPAPAAQVNAETIVARDPEVILLGDTATPVQPQRPADVARRPGWAAISAVKSRQVFAVSSGKITRPGPRLVEGLEEVARLLHPERFQ